MNWIALLAIIVSIVVLYFVGTIITSPFVDESKDSFYDTFVKLIVGFLTVTTVYAIVKTGGNTVQLGLLLLGAFYIVRKALKKDIRRPIFKISLAGISTACAVGLLFFIYYALFYYNTPVNNIFHVDIYVYAFNSYNNQLYGIEAAGIYLDGMPRATPYHYIEGWLCALIANLFHINYLEIFSICLPCIFSSIVIIGLVSFARTYTDKFGIVVFASFTIFLSAVLLDYSPILQSMAIGGNFKNSLVAMFILGFMISIRNGKMNYSWMLCLPIVNASLAPIIMSSLFIFSFVMYYKFDKVKQMLICNIAEIFTLSIFIVLFYVLQRNDFPQANSLGILSPTLISSYSISRFFHMGYRTIVNYAMYVPYLIPLIIIFAIKRETVSVFFKSHGKQLIFIVISAFCGFVLHYLYYPIDNYNSGQLDTLVNMTIMNLMVLMIILFVVQNIERKIFRIAMFSFMMIVGVYNVWVFSESILSRRTVLAEKLDIDYRNNILDYFSEHNVPLIGARLLPSDLLGNYYKNTYDIYQMGFLGGSLDGVATLFLSPLNLSEEQSHWNSIIPQSNTFNDYLSQFDAPYDFESVQIDFIKRYNLGYVVAHPRADLSNDILSIVDTTFIDVKTGERFMFLKR